jgi:hypothetical protein
LCLVLAITVNAIGEHDRVTELLQDEVKRTPTMSNGGDDTHPDAYGNMEERPEDSAPAENSDDAGPTDTQQGTGYFRDIPNAPGPRHGLPGYKESHQWETDTDMFSPLVFDWRFYRAKYLKGTEDEMTTKQDWLENVIERKDANGKADPLKVPMCRQGVGGFGANEYQEANKDKTDVKLLGGGCKDLIAHYQKAGLFSAYPTAVNPMKYDNIAINLLTPLMARPSDKSPKFEAGKGTHFAGLPQGVPISPNVFVAARHMLLQYWMRVKSSSKLPLGEYMGYGGRASDSFFRSGFGCLDAEFKKCFFIFAFGAASGEEYFHSFNDANFEMKQTAFQKGAWGHLTLILSTAKPADCPANEQGKDEGACKGMFEVFINGKELKLVDWNHGESTENAKKFTRGPVVPIWTKVEVQDGAEGGTVLRRLFISPPKDCDASNKNCGGVTNNNYKIGFPWPDPWTDNLFICDMSHMPAAPTTEGGFGDAAKRTLLAEATYKAAKQRVKQACGE